MLPRHADAKLVEWASRSYVMEAIEAGVKVYLSIRQALIIVNCW